jgi:leucyl/phenylalanyl-tRNA---protein transferase
MQILTAAPGVRDGRARLGASRLTPASRKPWLNPDRADEFGLVAVGGDLEPETMLLAYSRGVFPWYGLDQPVCWWSPDPRAVIELDGLHISRRLRRTFRVSKFTTTVNRTFDDVLAGCADRPAAETWITPDMVAAYRRLYELGHCHSVEAWRDGELAGGVFGVTVGGLFAGQSMFHRQTDSSKVALVALVERLRQCGFGLFDVQFCTAHTTRMGAVEIARADYLRRLAEAVERDTRFPGPLMSCRGRNEQNRRALSC